jgi:TonB family protein
MLKPTCLWFALLLAVTLPAAAHDRKIKTQVAPTYPEIMRKNNMGGTVKLRITISPDGRVSEAKALGGHPMLIAPATDAVKQWKYEPGTEETTTVIEIRFDPTHQ